MKAPRRFSILLPLAAWLSVPSCFSDNDPSYQGILGISRPPPEQPEEPWITGGGTSVTTTGEPTSGGTRGDGGQAGAIQGEGGAGAETTGAGATGGTETTGGPIDMNPPVDPNFSPACFEQLSQNGEEIKKGTPCTPDDPQLCYRPCGPNQIGWKSETCLAGVYSEGDCTFPDGDDRDYSCYAIPEQIDVEYCGLEGPPFATDECDAPLCVVCNFEGQYQDTGDNVKDGFCVCREPDFEGVRRWTCASDTAWPCPFGRGC